MKRSERIAAILDQLAASGSLDVGQLANAHRVSAATVRRDLQTLEDQRLLSRTHGGAIASSVDYELPIRYRDGQHHEAKRLIAREAARRIPTGGAVVALTGGTTTTEVAKCLADRTDVTVVTNALNIAALLAVRPRMKVIVTGGVARQQSYELVGPLAEQTLEGLNIEVAFVGVNGITARAGLTTHDEVEAHTDRVMLRRARRVVVVADGTKVGQVRMASIAASSEVSTLITDSTAPAAEVEALRQVGIEVFRVD